ncbi:hypothetical protein P4641_09120 [Halalkalibacterium halodurans]|uniref:hypothetical protein n=1 Tax=Halalkalibacterium halodurans TaxID=86665 RepID=UPI002E1F9A3D|nr:hypothetical protein [Halalkalibacterium halodurans]
MVDVDDIDATETLLNIVEDNDIQSSVLETDNGLHFYFRGYDLTSNKIKWYSKIQKAKQYDPMPAWLYIKKNRGYFSKDFS